MTTRNAWYPEAQKAQTIGTPRVYADADRIAANVLPVIQQARTAGASSLRAIAEMLDRLSGLSGTFGVSVL